MSVSISQAESQSVFSLVLKFESLAWPCSFSSSSSNCSLPCRFSPLQRSKQVSGSKVIGHLIDSLVLHQRETSSPYFPMWGPLGVLLQLFVYIYVVCIPWIICAILQEHHHDENDHSRSFDTPTEMPIMPIYWTR